jgi:hypothetical protein
VHDGVQSMIEVQFKAHNMFHFGDTTKKRIDKVNVSLLLATRGLYYQFYGSMSTKDQSIHW